MKDDVLRFAGPVTLVGGGALDRETLAAAMAHAPDLVAADGAADRLAAWGHLPAAVIGDMDSIADRAQWEAGPAIVRHLPEQDSTDFEKCLYVTEAPFYLAAGFTGRRLDHTLAVLHAMLAQPGKRVILVGEMEVAALMPPGRVITLDVAPGETVSFFPLLPATGIASEGLKWPIDGLAMALGRQSGTSNRAVAGTVRAGFDGPGVVVMVAKRFLDGLIGALCR